MRQVGDCGDDGGIDEQQPTGQGQVEKEHK